MPTAVPITSPGRGILVKIDTISVATKTNQTAATGDASSVTLEAGKLYLPVPYGTARVAPGSSGFTDTECNRYNESSGPLDGSKPGYPWANLGVRLAGVVGRKTSQNLRGDYQSEHAKVRSR